MKRLSLLDRIVILVAVVVFSSGGFLLYREFTAPRLSSTPPADLDFYPDPIQTPVQSVFLPPIEKASTKFLFEPKAEYSITGTLVSKRGYFGSAVNRLAPMDYAIVWGPVTHLLDKIKFRQVVRFCLFRTKCDDPVDPVFIGRHMSNNHIIPSTPNLRKALGRAKKGNIVKLDGYLVWVTVLQKGQMGGNWNSSLVRTDDGNGACEIIYLTRLQIGNKVYE